MRRIDENILNKPKHIDNSSFESMKGKKIERLNIISFHCGPSNKGDNPMESSIRL